MNKADQLAYVCELEDKLDRASKLASEYANQMLVRPRFDFDKPYDPHDSFNNETIKKSIIKGMNTPVNECDDKIDW